MSTDRTRKEDGLNEILDSLTNANILELANDRRVLFGAGLVFIVALIFRWKFVLALLLGTAGTLFIIRYVNMDKGQASLDQNLVIFGLGTVVVAGFLIYFLFIRGD